MAIVANFASYATIKGSASIPIVCSMARNVMVVYLVVIVMGGRVILFFTARRFDFEKAQPLVWLEWLKRTCLLVGLFVLSFSSR
ncbi:hypothetical protein O9992_05045 [Vibrio lentus]|nr:hypothetical protein [Vibrio lentus]